MDKKTSALISLQRLAMEQVSLSLSLCRTVARARELAGSGRRLLGGAQLVTPGRGRVHQAGNQAEARAKVMLALSQGDSGRDSPEVGDGNVFSAAVADAPGLPLLCESCSRFPTSSAARPMRAMTAHLGSMPASLARSIGL